MFEYFWLICGLWCGVAGALFLRGNLQKLVRSGEVTQDQVNAFSRQYALWILVPSVLLWLLQVSLGPRGSFEFLRWPQPQKGAALGIVFFLWAALGYYVFLRDGAAMLASYLGYPPLAIRLLTILAIMSGLFAVLANEA